ncbi:unnamed protein product [Phaedon cochleariae]|uniref:Major facilitator superfamily (MFS) profile domain-containing protein n=1 Tax=Phaedon cochleariae TaxID=80249 RepID=A0A9P0DSR1_PHACE|nr:unnamed protein product [Phaedon cochleariae]
MTDKISNKKVVMEANVVNEYKEEVKTWPQVLTIIIACLAPFTNGVLLTWSSPFIVKITEDKVNYNITEDETSYFNIIEPLAMILACTLVPRLCDMIGRKNMLLSITIPQLSAWLLTILGTNVYLFYGMKFCSGISHGIAFSALPTYIGEISTPQVRGSWGCLFISSMYFGYLVIAIVGNYFTIKQTAYIFLPLPILFCVLFSMMPESPHYYAMKGMDEEAKKSLRKFSRKKNVEADFLEMKSDISRQLSEKKGWKDLIVVRSNRRALAAGIFLRISPSFGALTVFLVYAQLFFEKAGGEVSSAAASIYYMGISFALNLLVVVFVIHSLKRKTCYIMSSLPSGFMLILMSVYLFIDENYPQIDVSSFSWVPLTGMILYQIFASYGLAVIPTLMLGELFSASIKSKAVSVVMIAFGLSLLTANYFFYYLYSTFGLYAPLFVFGCCNIVSTVLSFYLIPDTRGKTLEEIQQSLKKIKQSSDGH